MLPGLGNPMIASVHPPPVLTYIGQGTVASFGTTTLSSTVTAAPIGVASADRRVVVALWGDNQNGVTRTIASVTIGGIAATLCVVDDIGSSGTTNRHRSIWAANVPTGTTGDIVVTWDSTTSLSYSLKYAAYTIAGALATAPTATNDTTSTTAAMAGANSWATGAVGISLWYVSVTTGSAPYAISNAVADFESASGSNTTAVQVAHITAAGTLSVNVGSLYSVTGGWALITAIWT